MGIVLPCFMGRCVVSSSVTKPFFMLTRNEWALIVITMVWGTTFLIVHKAMTVSGPLFFVGVRFATATGVMLLFSWPVLRGMSRQDLIAGTAIGISIFVGYTLQTYGLQTIPSSKSAFLTALYVPMVPLLQWLVLRRRPHVMSWLGVGFAFMGLVFLAGPKGVVGGLGRGEVFTIISAVGVAVEIILISLFAPKVDVRRVVVVQLVVTSILAFLLMKPMGEGVPVFSWVLVWCACGLGVATAAIQLTMNWAQRSVSPTRATLIYAGESVWAGIFGRVAGERLGVMELVGGALIVVGVIVSELRWKWRRKQRQMFIEKRGLLEENKKSE